jgi:hypothetical protein
MDQTTIDQFKQALPATLKKSVNPELIKKIDATLNDPDMYETYRDNLLSYTRVMQEGKFKVSNYIDAVKYVSHKLMGKTNIDAFSTTFPEKIDRWNKQGVLPKDIASYVTAYNKSKLVNLLMEQTLVPSWVLNQDLFQRALNVQAELMVSAHSEKVRSDAANSLLTHLKRPETQKMELQVNTQEDGSIQALRESTQQLVKMQREMIQQGGMNAQEVAHSRIIEGEKVED